MRPRAFTLVELLVVVSIISLLVTILMPSLSRARELARQAVCGVNLNSIGKAMMLYRHDNESQYPDHTNDGEWSLDGPGGTADTPYALNDSGLESLNLLVYSRFLTFHFFRCPSVGGTVACRYPNQRYGFYARRSSDSLSKQMFVDYGLHLGSMSDDRGDHNPAAFREDMDGQMVIMADRPTPEKYATAWSINHPDDGENVLKASCSVKFSKDDDGDDKNLGGWGNNNIYVKDMDENDNVGSASDTSGNDTWADSEYDSIVFWEEGSS